MKELTYIKGVDYDRVKTQATNKFSSTTENLLISKDNIETRLEKNIRIVSELESAFEILELDEKSQTEY